MSKGETMDITQIMQRVMASRSDTNVALAFRKALGIERMHPQPVPTVRARKRKRKEKVNYAEIMNNKIGACDRHGK